MDALVGKSGTTDNYLIHMQQFLDDHFGPGNAGVTRLDEEGGLLVTVQGVFPAKVQAHLLVALSTRCALNFEIVEIIEDDPWTNFMLRVSA